MQMVSITNVSWSSLIAFIIFNMTTIPCFAAVATAKAELPEGKFGSTIGFWLVVSYLTGTLAYLILLPFDKGWGAYWWSEIIAVAIIACIVGYVYLYNNWKKIKANHKKA